MILSTNQKLINVGKEYSAGNGIEISSYVISYTGDSGQEYIAGENIGINDFVISSRNWTPDITNASESAYQRATDYTNNQISALSGEVSAEVLQLNSDIDYISGVALTAHQSLDGYLTKASGDEYYQPIGSYATVSQLENTSGEIVNLIPSIEGLATEEYVNEQTSGKANKSEIPDVSQFITNVSAESTYQPIGNYLSSNALEGYATQDWVNEQGYITGVDLSNYYTKTDTSSKEELSAAFANLPQGDVEVNSLVHSNSAEWNNVSAKLDTTAYTPFDPSYMSGAIDDKLNTTAFSTVSGDFLTSIPDEYATKDFVSNSITGKLNISSFSSVSGDFLTDEDLNGYATESFVENVSGDITALIPTDYYPNSNPSGFITGVDLSDYYKKTETSSKEEISAAIAAIPLGDIEVNQAVHTKSATWNTVSDKLDITAFSNVSGTFLTAHQSLEGYATVTLVEETSGSITSLIPTNYYPDTNPSGFISGVDLTPYQTVSGMTAYQPVGDYATTAQIDNLSGAIDYVSANAGSVISSYTSAYTNKIPPYGGYVINSLNGLYLSALESNSADRANYATNSNSANSAGYAQSVNVTNVENQGFVRNLSSEYGTISVVRNNIIDSTNSAISRTGYEGFVSALGESETIGPLPYGIMNFSWNKSLPNTTFNCNPNHAKPESIVYYSANTNLTGEIELPNEPNPKVNINVPNATALSLWCNNYIQIKDIVASAADTFETVIGELAWASALNDKLDTTAFSTVSGSFLTAVDLSDYATTAELALKQDTLTFGFDEQNKISAINGSALAVGGGVTGEFVPLSSFNELKQSYDTLSSLFATYSGQWLLPNEGV